MSRFLMPSDISLLALVELYTEGAVPSGAIIPVLSFLASHTGIDPTKDSSSSRECWQKAHDNIHMVNSVKAFEVLLSPFPAAVGLPGRRLWHLFLAKLWAIDSLDALHNFFDSQPTLLATKEDIRRMVEPEDGTQKSRIPLVPNSPLAMFVRKAHLEFNRLHFEDASTLWKDFINSDREHYHYALLNLAVLQADFGCYKDSISTMLETIATAREKKDQSCLNFALNFFYNFSLQHPHLVEDLESSTVSATGQETLAFLRVKAKEMGMWSTWSSALLNEARQGLLSGDSVASVLENVARSSHLLVERNLTNMIGAHIAMGVAVWDRAGVAFLSTMMCEVFLRCHAPNAMLDDSLRIKGRLASISASKGRYNESMELLENMDQNFLRSWKAKKYWQRLRALIKLRRDLHRNDLDGAKYLLSQIMQSKPDDLEPDLTFHVDALHYELLIRRGDFQTAFAMVEQLISESHTQDCALRTRLLLMKAQLFGKAGRPQRGFSIAMRAANLAWKARLTSLLWQAIGTIADILTSLEEFEAAEKLLLVIIPRCLECEGIYTAANLYSSLADAYVGTAGKMGPTTGPGTGPSKRRTEYLTKATGALRIAFDYYASVEDVQKKMEVTAKLSAIMRVRGDVKVSNDLAAKYLELREEAKQLGGSAT
ncbi:APC5 protein [Cytospora paraplurivora]|uniref:Anaphase-promoting complex subunit 5 n=1 Tax=Cytospora paraplurivora TaxID=2898453 RepID=A0AAN9UGM3_9PEZI